MIVFGNWKLTVLSVLASSLLFRMCPASANGAQPGVVVHTIGCG